MLLSTAPIVKNSDILAEIYFVFKKNVLDQTWKEKLLSSKTKWSIFLQHSLSNFRLRLC